MAGSHYTDRDGCVNKLVLSYSENGADLCCAPYHKLFSDTCNQPAMKRGEDECWWKGGWACIKHAFEPWLGMHVILTGHVEERALEYVCIWTFQGDLVQKHQTKWCFKDLDWGKKGFQINFTYKTKQAQFDACCYACFAALCPKHTGLHRATAEHAHMNQNFYENVTSLCLFPPPLQVLLPHKHYKHLLLRSWKCSY